MDTSLHTRWWWCPNRAAHGAVRCADWGRWSRHLWELSNLTSHVAGNRGSRPFQVLEHSEPIIHMDWRRWSEGLFQHNGLADQINGRGCHPMYTAGWHSPVEVPGPDHGSVTSGPCVTEETTGWIETLWSMKLQVLCLDSGSGGKLQDKFFFFFGTVHFPKVWWFLAAV